MIIEVVKAMAATVGTGTKLSLIDISRKGHLTKWPFLLGFVTIKQLLFITKLC
jgi:hypothetical protein